MADQRLTTCPECGEEVGGLTRRDFLKGVSATAAPPGAGALPAVAASPRPPLGVPKPAPETLVKRLYESLRPEQQKVVCLPWDHAARTRISANWAITKPTIADFFTGEQQDL